jgi:hypothetical protein
MHIMKNLHFHLLWLLVFCLPLQSTLAETQLSLGDNVVELTAEPESTANKARLLRLQDGALVVLWHQEHGAPGGAWDLNGTPLAPRDIFITLSVDGGTVWSPPVNISETAELTDSGAFYDQSGDGTGLANFYGDSGKARQTSMVIRVRRPLLLRVTISLSYGMMPIVETVTMAPRAMRDSQVS